MFIKDLVAGIWSKAVEPKIESYAVELADVLYSDKRIKENVQAHLLKKYGNEVYYNDLDGYVTTHHVIELLIKAIRGESSVQSRIERQFKITNAKRFIEYNPQYKRNKVVSSRIPGIFGEIYNIVLASVSFLDPHSDLGKLQQTVEIARDTILDSHQTSDAKLDKILEAVQLKQPLLTSDGIAATATENIGKCSEEIARVTEKIKEIEKEYQKNHRFNDALSRYYGLLQSVATTLVGHSQEQVNTLICTLYCNIALCQSNLGFVEKAFESLAAIPENTASKSKVYHMVYAMIYLQQNDLENYDDALVHADAALAIDAGYHHAFSVRQYLRAYLYPEDTQAILRELETHYANILSQGEDHSNIGEYYQIHGLINLHSGYYAAAIDDFRLAETYGYDPYTTKLNIAVTLYGEATADMPKGKRLLAHPVNQKIMIEAIDILYEVIDMLKGNVDYDDVRKRAIALYVSACASLGKKHDLNPVADYIYEGQAYDDLRAVLLGTKEELTDSQLSLLTPEDRAFCTVRDMMSNDESDKCKSYIVDLIESGSQVISAPIYHVLLQTCLITKSSSDYWKYRENVNEYGISGDLLESMDACAYELDGDFLNAKAVFDKIASVCVDDNILDNTLRFYYRNDCTEEIRKLLLRMHELITSKSMYTDKAEPFYRRANEFFLSQKDPVVRKMLAELPEDLVSNECRLQLHASYFSEIFDSSGLLDCLHDLSCASGGFTNAFSTALCSARLFKYDEALQICYDLEKRTTNTEEKVKLFWMISDIHLLQNNLDDSYLWARKAHEITSTNPYDRSHQAFFTRSMRCNHQEALKELVEYKDEHPVVINWLHKFSISEEDEDIVSCIKNALEAFDPEHDSYIKHEREIAKLYRRGIVPINMLLKRYEDNLWNLFNFASEHKLNLACGNYKKLMADCKIIDKSIVVDALTLVVLAYHGCLSVFDEFDHVYVNYRSIATIQQLFLIHGYTYMSDLLAWLQTAEIICFEPDGFVDYESTIAEIFSSDFVACCNIASTYKIPYLYCDLTAVNFQRIPELGIAPDVVFVSIPAVCYKAFANNKEKLSDSLYCLMKDSTFINFDAGTILHQIRKQNYSVSSELMDPFMCCKSNCDMHSFAVVYLSAMAILQDEQYEAAISLANIVLNDAFKIWKRGIYYRQLSRSVEDSIVQHKADVISEYVLEILQGIEQVFKIIPDEIAFAYDNLSEKAGYINE